MPGPIFTPTLWAHDADGKTGWGSLTLRFRKTDVVAHTSISAFPSMPDGRPSYGETWVLAPPGSGPLHTWARDAQIHTNTNGLTFWVASQSGPIAAVGAVFADITPWILDPLRELSWVRYTTDGLVRSVDTLVLLEGAEDVDTDLFERQLRDSGLPGVSEELLVRPFVRAEWLRPARLKVDPTSGEIHADEIPNGGIPRE
jgi:hypothetical protein